MHEFKHERMREKEQSKHIVLYKITAFEPTTTTYRATLELMTEFNDHRSRKQTKDWELLGNKFMQACKSMIWPHLKCCVLVSSSQKMRQESGLENVLRKATWIHHGMEQSLYQKGLSKQELQHGKEVTQRGCDKHLKIKGGVK